MIKFIFTACILFFFIVESGDIQAREKAEDHHKRIIETCQSKSQSKWNTGVSITMEEGTYEYIQCLTDEIEKISDVYFIRPDSHFINPHAYFENSNKSYNKEKFLKSLNSFTEEALELYNYIHYGPCSPCGTQHVPMRIMDVAIHVEMILKNILYQADEYERPVDDP